MAAESDITHDLQAHERSYSRFLGMMKWGTIVSLALTAIVVLLIS